MTHSRIVFGVFVAVGLGLVLSNPAMAQLGKRDVGSVKTMGSRKGLTKEEAERMTKAETISASDIRSTQDRLKKLAAQKEAIIRRLINIMENNLKLEDPDAAKYPDYLFRVAEHYNAMRMNQWQSAMALHEVIFKAEDSGQKAQADRMKKQQKLL
ncbi:MAG: hypothetical protein RBU30_17825, partial [Polyangia bacterium]|nr:hypothetical protein [Polyangia bacterium]